jgi:hypothetical protein
MRVFVKEWPNQTATLLTENGQVIWTFDSVALAKSACREWFSTLAEHTEIFELIDAEPLSGSCSP